MNIREWLEQVINSNIFPRIEGIHIRAIPLAEAAAIFVVSIPKSFRGPHQAKDKRYYKRYNSESMPMEDYEVRDVLNRQNQVPPLMNIDVETGKSAMVTLVVENIGKFPASDVKFSFPNGIKWCEGREIPSLLQQGAKVIPPGRKFRYFYSTYPEIVNGPGPRSLDVEISYFHPELGERINESFHIDFMDFFQTLITHSELDEIGKILKDTLDKLTSEIRDLDAKLESISTISSPTGLEFSQRAIRNLAHVVKQDGQIEKLNPYETDNRVFHDVLEVDFQLARDLERFFEGQNGGKKLRETIGLDEAIIARLLENFEVRSEDI